MAFFVLSSFCIFLAGAVPAKKDTKGLLTHGLLFLLKPKPLFSFLFVYSVVQVFLIGVGFFLESLFLQTPLTILLASYTCLAYQRLARSVFRSKICKSRIGWDRWRRKKQRVGAGSSRIWNCHPV